MILNVWFWCMAAALLYAPPVAAQANLQGEVQRILGAYDDRVAVALLQPATGNSLWIRADQPFPAASTMKLPVLAELARRIDRGERRWDATLLVRNRFRSVVDGSPISNTRAYDPERSLYAADGERVRYAELARRMTAESSNLATNLLLQDLGLEAVNRVEPGIRTRAFLADAPAQREGLRNTTTARALARLLAGIESGEVASPVQTDSMRAFLKAQVFGGGIPAGLPAGVSVGHKTGETPTVYHDAAVIFPPAAPPFVLVVLTRDVPQNKAKRLAADVAAAAYRHLVLSPLPLE